MTKSLLTKKRNRFFASYIGKLLKGSHPKKGVTTNTKQQLNSICCYLAKCLSTDSKTMATISNKKTISEGEVLSVICISFPNKIYLRANKVNSKIKKVYLHARTKDGTIIKRKKCYISNNGKVIGKITLNRSQAQIISIVTIDSDDKKKEQGSYNLESL